MENYLHSLIKLQLTANYSLGMWVYYCITLEYLKRFVFVNDKCKHRTFMTIVNRNFSCNFVMERPNKVKLGLPI